MHGLKIRCWLCNKLVDQTIVEHDPVDHAWKIVAKCHGDRDVMTVGMEVIRDHRDFAQQLRGQEGRAFDRPALAPPSERLIFRPDDEETASERDASRY